MSEAKDDYPPYKLFEPGYAPRPIIVGEGAESPDTVTLRYEEEVAARNGGDYRRGSSPGLLPMSYGKPQPTPQMHSGYQDPYQSYPQSFGGTHQGQNPAPAQINDMAVANNAAVMYSTPTVISYQPSSGTFTTKVVIKISTQQDLTMMHPQPYFYVSFGQERCITQVQKDAQDHNGCIYSLYVDAPEFVATGSQDATVQVSLLVGGAGGESTTSVPVGTFYYHGAQGAGADGGASEGIVGGKGVSKSPEHRSLAGGVAGHNSGGGGVSGGVSGGGSPQLKHDQHQSTKHQPHQAQPDTLHHPDSTHATYSSGYPPAPVAPQSQTTSSTPTGTSGPNTSTTTHTHQHHHHQQHHHQQQHQQLPPPPTQHQALPQPSSSYAATGYANTNPIPSSSSALGSSSSTANMLSNYRPTPSFNDPLIRTSLRSPGWSPYPGGPLDATGTGANTRSPALGRPSPLSPLPEPPSSNPSAPVLIRTSTIQSAGSPSAAASAFNPYAYYPNKAQLKINGSLESMAESWTQEEVENRRRLVVFKKSQSGSTINMSFRPVTASERPPHSICISCIWWAEKGECFVTSVDTIYLLEQLLAAPARFTVEEKNRIRRNLEGFHPLTVSKAKPDSEEFFKIIMAFPTPKPRNIEKDVKVFPWKVLGQALKKIISKYSASPSSTMPPAGVHHGGNHGGHQGGHSLGHAGHHSHPSHHPGAIMTGVGPASTPMGYPSLPPTPTDMAPPPHHTSHPYGPAAGGAPPPPPAPQAPSSHPSASSHGLQSPATTGGGPASWAGTQYPPPPTTSSSGVSAARPLSPSTATGGGVSGAAAASLRIYDTTARHSAVPTTGAGAYGMPTTTTYGGYGQDAGVGYHGGYGGGYGDGGQRA